MSIFVLMSVFVGTTLTAAFTWYQSKNTQQGNHVLQVTFEEYYDAMSKDLSAKLNEMVTFIEQIPVASHESRKARHVTNTENETDDDPQAGQAIPTLSSEQLDDQQESLAKLETQLERALSIIVQQQAQQEQILAQLDALRNTPTPVVAPATAPTVIPTAVPINKPLNDRQDEIINSIAQTQKSLTQLHTKLSGLEQQLAQTDQHINDVQDQFKKQGQTVQGVPNQLQETVSGLGKQIAQLDQKIGETQEQLKKQGQSIQSLPNQLESRLANVDQALSGLKQDIQRLQATKSAPETDKILAEQLSKLQKELADIKQMQQSLKANKAPANAVQDRELAEQISRLQRDIRDIKQQQSGIKDQVQDVKQNLPAPSQPPYQYRLDVERYPR